MGHERRIKIIVPLWMVVFLVSALPIITQAGVPMLINYQGYLTDSRGTPLSGKQSVNFRLYSAETGGFLFWEEEQLVEVTDGIFNVQLGTVNLLLPSVFNFDNLYLEIEIFDADSGWETLTPRQQFTSTAFAVRAGNADMLEGQTLSDLDADYVNAGEPDAVTAVMIADNSIGASELGDDSVGAAEIIAGAVATAKLADNAVTTDKLADNAVGSGQVADNSLTALDLAINSVTAIEIADGAVGTSEIADGTVTASDLADDYVNTTGDTMTGDLNIEGDINTNGVLKMDGEHVLKIDSSNHNSFLGEFAGRYNSTGTGNTLLGKFAGEFNSTGFNNTFVGKSTGRFNTTGSNNIFIGERAGQSNSEGHANTFLGILAGDENTTGDNNTLIGSYAGTLNTEGDNNTFIGSYAGRSNTSGQENIYIGHSAGFSNTTGHHNVFIGSQAGRNETGSDRLYIDNSDTSTPLIYGDFSINSLVINATLAVPGLTGTSSYNVLKYDTGTGTFYYDSSSDRYKEQIQDLEDDFYKILNARPKTYVDKTSNQREIGYIAEDFDEMGLNDLVIYNGEGFPNGLKYDRIPLYLLEIIKDQQIKIEGLQMVAEQQQKIMAAMAKRLTRLEKQR